MTAVHEIDRMLENWGHWEQETRKRLPFRQEVILVEPLPSPSGLIFYFDVLYGKTCPDCGNRFPCLGPHGAD